MIKTRSLGLRVRSLKGLSLIEVCLAIAILSLIFANLSFIFDQGYSFLRKTRFSRLALFLAEEKMEELLHEYTVDYPVNFNETKNETPYAAPYQAFQREVNITRPVPSSLASTWCGNTGCGDRLALVNVTIYWPGASGEQSFSLVSLVSNSSH